MASSGTVKRSRAFRGIVWVAVVALVLFAGLTAAWFYLASELESRVEAVLQQTGEQGTLVGCGGREVFGYPFRLGLRCETTSVSRPVDGLELTAGAMRTAAQIYNPSRIVAELDGPLTVAETGSTPFVANWALGQASLVFSGQGVERFSLVLDEPTLAIQAQPALALGSATRAEVHARRNGADLDLAIRDDGVAPVLPGMGALPPFDLYADLSLVGAAETLDSGLPPGGVSGLVRGRAGTLRAVRVTLAGGGLAELAGPFEVSPEGEISGRFQVSVENADAIAGLIGTLVPGSAGIARTIAGALPLAGRREGNRTIVSIDVEDGEARLGFIRIGRLPNV